MEQPPGAPPPPGSPELTGHEPPAWERRHELGFFRALWETWKATLMKPEVFWARFPPEGPKADALFYGWLITAITMVIEIPFFALQMGMQAPQLRATFAHLHNVPPEVRQILDVFSSGGGILAWILFFVAVAVIYPLTAIINSALIHVCLLLFGAGKSGYWATFRVFGYASGPTVLSGIPLVGVGGALWSLVLLIWGVARVHEVKTWRAAAGVLLIPVLFLCCFCGAGAFAIAAAVSSMH